MKRNTDKLIQKLKKIGEQEIKTKKIIKKADSKELKSSNKQKRKNREHKLIKIGALFEIEGLLEETPALLLGYLMQFHHISIEQKKRLYTLGKNKLEERERDRTKNEIKILKDEEIVYLLKIAYKKNIDPMREIYKLTKKTNLETITISEYEKLIHYFSN